MSVMKPGDEKSSVENLLLYLLGIASNTQGSEVWRALFSECLASHRKEQELERARFDNQCLSNDLSVYRKANNDGTPTTTLTDYPGHQVQERGK